MLALLDPSQLPLSRGVTLTALPLLQYLFQHDSDSPKTWSWAVHRCSGRYRKLSSSWLEGLGLGDRCSCAKEKTPRGLGSTMALYQGGLLGSLELLSVPVVRWAGPCCPSWGRLTHPACQHPQGQTSFSQPQWEGSRLIQDAKGANPLWDCRGSLVLAGVQIPQGREWSSVCPRPALSSAWTVSPAICGHGNTGVP